MESVSGADGDFVAAARGAQRLRELRILPGIWMRSRSEVEFAGGDDSRGRKDRALRNSAEFLRSPIEVDANGRATGAVYFDAQRNVHLQKAKAVVISANGAETPRLLLLSANKQFPNGLANSSGLVGKYLMLNSGAISVGVFEEPLNDYKGFAVSRIIHDFYELDPQKVGFYGGGGVDARFDLTPIGFATGALPPDTPRWGKGFKDALAHNFTRTMEVMSHGTSLATGDEQLFARSRCEGRLGTPGAAHDV